MAGSEGPALTLPRARVLVIAGYEALERRKQEINDLNVYPVPDGDTGTNMALTVRSVLEDLDQLSPQTDPAELAEAFSNAALMGARGNSGVILSQMVRGAAEVLGTSPELTPAVVAQALRRATDAAYRAVRRPVEGTMLTVLREMAEAAVEVEGRSWTDFVPAVVDAGWMSVGRTPTLLKVLADAGVVDAGGFGLVVLVQAMLSAGMGVPEVGTAEPATLEPSRPAAESSPKPAAEETSRFTYCTSFFVSGESFDLAAFEEALAPLGDSLLVVGGGGSAKVHIHTDDPGIVLGLATVRGELSHVEIDNMREQAKERSRRLAGTLEPGTLTQVVAVVAGEGNRLLFQSLGASVLVDGGQSMNPSAEELLEGVRATAAPAAVILPNNKNIILAAEHVPALIDREVLVVPTRSLQAGLTALVGFDPKLPGAENVARMEVAIAQLITAEVTRAVRDSTVDGLEIRQGEFIGLVEEEVVAASPDLDRVLETVAERLIDEEKELVTVLVGVGEDSEGAKAAVARLRERYPDVEVEVYDGGQPLYQLLLSAE